MRGWFVICTAFMLSTTVYGQTGDGHKLARKTTQAMLSGQQIRGSIIGNTLTGVEDGEAYTEFLRSDGSISGRSKSGRYSGSWRISGNQLCFLYKGNKRKAWDCSFVTLHGSRIVWSSKGGGNRSVSTLRRGNPRGL
jgi:hypothetical protein